jgi:hypothetical protein
MDILTEKWIDRQTDKWLDRESVNRYDYCFLSSTQGSAAPEGSAAGRQRVLQLKHFVSRN